MDTPFHAWAHFVLEPSVEDLMEVHVCEERRHDAFRGHVVFRGDRLRVPPDLRAALPVSTPFRGHVVFQEPIKILL